jgi:hypothetical protein
MFSQVALVTKILIYLKSVHASVMEYKQYVALQKLIKKAFSVDITILKYVAIKKLDIFAVNNQHTEMPVGAFHRGSPNSLNLRHILFI